MVSFHHFGYCAQSPHALEAHISNSNVNNFNHCFETQRTNKWIRTAITTARSTLPLSQNSNTDGNVWREPNFKNSEELSSVSQYSNRNDICNQDIIGNFCSAFTMYDSIRSNCQKDKAEPVISELHLKLSETCGDFLFDETLQALGENMTYLARFVSWWRTMKEIQIFFGKNFENYVGGKGFQHTKMSSSASTSAEL